jgi:PAS domain S-box-containing protein
MDHQGALSMDNLNRPHLGRPPSGLTGGAASVDSQAEAASSGDAAINILIVDDEPKNLTVLETILDDPAYRLVRAESADQALLALLVEEFALLILDIRMPGVTGFELAQMIKQRKKTSRVPIIFLTAYYNEDQHVLEGYGTGAVDYLLKPVAAAVLRSKVAIFGELYRKQRELELANRALLEEVRSRRHAEEQLRELNNTLEQHVFERTASLRLSEERLRAIYDGTSEYMGLLTPDGTLREANRSALEFAGSRLEDVVGLPFWEGVWFKFTPGASEIVRQAIMLAATGEQVRFETPMTTPSGEAKTFDVSFRPIRDERGKVIFIVPTALDITGRKRAEEHVRGLIKEVNHRSKNILSVVQAIARQTAATNPEEFVPRFSERVRALAASHDLIFQHQWQGIEIAELLRAHLALFEDLLDRRIVIDGPPLRLSVAAAQVIGMILHELATNASKYGALSDDVGRVEIEWGVDWTDGRFTMGWIERGGPAVTAPPRRGFGSSVIKSMAELSLDAEVELDFASNGVIWRLACPLEKVFDKGETRMGGMDT